MKIYLGNVGKLQYIDVCRQNDYGICYLANHWSYPKEGISWFLDNGAFHSWKNDEPFDSAGFRDALWKVEKSCSSPDFIVTPDIVAGGLESLQFSLEWLQEIPAGIPAYLAVQDGMKPEDLDIINQFDGVFVGGTPGWKWCTLTEWVNFAHNEGLPCHVGRVGKFRDILRARTAGVDSIDSSTITQANKNGVFGQWDGFRRLEAVECQSTLHVLERGYDILMREVDTC